MTNYAIDIQNLSFAYPDGHQALSNIDLQVQSGEKIALVGPNGAGKSTLLLHFNGILQGQGSIKICGAEINKASLGRIRAMVGVVFQSPDDQLFSPTVFDDVAFGPIYQGLPANEVNNRVREALDAVHMQEYIQRVSHHLSTGEKKRIAIATVLAMHPDILILDEPTAGLDPRARRTLIKLLAELPQTMIVATHDLHMVDELLPRTVVVDQGQIVADDLTRNILLNGKLLEAHGLEPIR